jgi:hypothetical protein
MIIKKPQKNLLRIIKNIRENKYDYSKIDYQHFQFKRYNNLRESWRVSTETG